MKMNRKKITILTAIILIIIVFAIVLSKQQTQITIENTISDETQLVNDENDLKEITVDGILEISKYGNVKINVSHTKVLEAFEYGDILTVSFGDRNIDVPLVKSFSDVDSGLPGLFLQMDGDIEETELAINMGNFAETYSIANKIVYEDKNYEWQYCEGISDNVTFNISLKQKSGYLDQYTIRSMEYTDSRDDYFMLSDEEFANFRSIAVGDIDEDVLFRSSSVINNEHNRNIYADNAAKNSGVTVFIDLTDSESSILEYEDIENSYFISQKHIAVGASMDFTSKENTEKLAEALRYMIDNPGTYCIFCDEGKGRTGVVAAILESLMGANYDEVVNDYMLSYINYYKINKTDDVYKITLNGTVNKNLTDIFGVNPETANLQEAAEKYLTSIGLNESEISKLKENLTGK